MAGRQLPPIRVAPGGRYFETTDGEPILFIGPNDAISWPGLAGLYRRRDLPAVDRYMADLAASGVTVLRLMLEYAHGKQHYFERPFGTFNPTMVRLWDDLFALCERHGVRILLTPWDTFWMARLWHNHPYNAVNGGPAQSPAAFFMDDTVVAATIRRLQFVIQRWGGSGVLAAWDLFNEVHPHWGGTPEQQAEVITRISREVRQHEIRTWGFTRPQTVSIFGPDPGPAYEELVFRHPEMDFASTHIYRGAIDFPKDTVRPAVTMGRWVRHAIARIPADRPFCDTEHGPIHLFNDHEKMLPEAVDDEYERHLMWAHLASGGAGSGMRWPARHPHLITAGAKRALASLSGFTRLLEWRCFRPLNAVRDVKVEGARVHTFACRSDVQAIVWLLPWPARADARGTSGVNDAREHTVVTLKGMAPGRYGVWPWDTGSGAGEASLSIEAGPDGRLRIELPHLAADLALAIRRQRSPEQEPDRMETAGQVATRKEFELT